MTDSTDLQAVWGPDGNVNWFPKEMSDADISKHMREEYATKGQKMENPSPDVAKDVVNSGLQGLRNFTEGVISAPAYADDLENSIINWMKSAGDAPIIQALPGGESIGNTLKTAGQNYEAYKNKLPLGNVPWPHYRDVQWAEDQLGLRPQYTPQTPAGQITYGGTIAGLGLGMGGPPVAGMARGAIANPYMQQFVGGALKALGPGLGAGLGLGAGGLGAYEMYKNFAGP